jgi:poly(A) polymerase
VALAALLLPCVDTAGAMAVCRRWRLSNGETDRVEWLVAHHASLDDAPSMRWSQLHPILTAAGAGDLLTLIEAAKPSGVATAAYCRRLLDRPREVIDPAPLLSGDDLLALGIPSGPRYKAILDRIRAAQLDGEVSTKADALARVEREE